MPSDHVVCTCRSPRTSSGRSRNAGGSSRCGCSRSSGGHHGTPSAPYNSASSAASGNGSRRTDIRRPSPIARTSAVPRDCRRRNDELDRHALDGDADRAALVALDDRDDLRKGLEGIEHRLGLVRGHDDGEVLARVLPAPRDRRRPPRRETRRLPAASAHARLRSNPRRGFGFPVRSRPARSFASVFGPIPGTDRSLPSMTALRNSSVVRTPSASASSRIRFGPTPSSCPRPTSSGISVARNSRSSASSPVSTSSRSRVSIPGPIPRSSRARPCSTSSATGARVSRISSAARR